MEGGGDNTELGGGRGGAWVRRTPLPVIEGDQGGGSELAVGDRGAASVGGRGRMLPQREGIRG
jgi:hypothetical protein